MKLYNKKRLLIGIGEFLLSIICIITILIQKSTDIKFIMLSLICLILGINSVFHAFSRKKVYEDRIEDLDERSKVIELTVNSNLLKIHTMIVVTLILVGIAVFSVTKNVMLIIAVLPLMLLLPLTFFLYIGLYIYYEKKM